MFIVSKAKYDYSVKECNFYKSEYYKMKKNTEGLENGIRNKIKENQELYDKIVDLENNLEKLEKNNLELENKNLVLEERNTDLQEKYHSQSSSIGGYQKQINKLKITNQDFIVERKLLEDTINKYQRNLSLKDEEIRDLEKLIDDANSKNKELLKVLETYSSKKKVTVENIKNYDKKYPVKKF